LAGQEVLEPPAALEVLVQWEALDQLDLVVRWVLQVGLGLQVRLVLRALQVQLDRKETLDQQAHRALREARVPLELPGYQDLQEPPEQLDRLECLEPQDRRGQQALQAQLDFLATQAARDRPVHLDQQGRLARLE